MTEQEMMQSEAYRRVVDAPGADHPREELAAWLEDRWPIRARFIRLEVAYARAERQWLSSGMPLDGRPKSGLDLLLANEREWEVPARSLGWLKDWGFVRGLIGLVHLDARVFLERADELFSLFPLRHVGLDGAGEVMRQLASCKHLERLVGLGLRKNSLGDEAIRILASSVHIRNLRWVDLYDNDIGVEGFEVLCASPCLESLAHVNLRENAAPDPARVAGYDWTGAKVYVSPLSRFGQEMESKYGYKRWLHGAELIHDYPPTWDAFDGDDP